MGDPSHDHSHQIDQAGPLVVYHLDFRFQLAILGQKIASTLGGVGGPKNRVRALWTQSVHHWTHFVHENRDAVP